MKTGFKNFFTKILTGSELQLGLRLERLGTEANGRKNEIGTRPKKVSVVFRRKCSDRVRCVVGVGAVVIVGVVVGVGVGGDRRRSVSVSLVSTTLRMLT